MLCPWSSTGTAGAAFGAGIGGNAGNSSSGSAELSSICELAVCCALAACCSELTELETSDKPAIWLSRLGIGEARNSEVACPDGGAAASILVAADGGAPFGLPVTLKVFMLVLCDERSR